jgi:malate dehydrogenase (oxaloacetate-decarboxylating)
VYILPSKEVLTKIYTPGVAKICLLIEALRSEARDLRDIASFLPTTGKEKLKVQKEILNRTEYINGTVLALSFTNAAIHINRITNYELVKRRISLVPDPVLIITDNTAVLGLGDIGTYAGIPVMVGKKMIMNYLGNINAIPISIETRDPKEIIEIVKMIAPDKGAINLEDISAPRCFEIEKQLDQDLKIPVFHDDQHGTAIVVAAALLNALKVTKRNIEDAKVFINGAGAAGLSIAELILTMGVQSQNLIVADTKGLIYAKRPHGMNPQKEIIAKMTNPQKTKGQLMDGIKGMDVFIGVSSKNILTTQMVKTMNKDSIVFAMANPDPEILPEEAKKGGACIIGTGRSDYPNQVNNALAFPGLLRGALESKHKINLEMKKMTAFIIAKWAEPKLSTDYILPSPLDLELHKAIAGEIKKKFS